MSLFAYEGQPYNAVDNKIILVDYGRFKFMKAFAATCKNPALSEEIEKLFNSLEESNGYKNSLGSCGRA